MSIYNNNNAIDNAFKSGETILAGYLNNPTKAISAQAKVEGDTSELLPACAVEIQNEVAGLGEGYSPSAIKITKIATDKVDGFILESETMVWDEGAVKALDGGTVQVALFGSGIRTYLPCASDIAGINLSAPIYYDKTQKVITASASGVATPLRVVGAVVKGYRREKQADNTTKWVSADVVEVQF